MSRVNGRRCIFIVSAALAFLASVGRESAASPSPVGDAQYEVTRDPIPGDPTVAKPVTEILPRAEFGRRGQVVLSADLALRGGARWSDGGDARSSSHFAVSPSFDAFVAEDFTLGAFASYSVAKSRAFGPEGSLNDYTTTSGGLGGRIGFNSPLGRWLSWWPRLTLGWSTSNYVASVVTPAAQATPATPGGYDYTQSGLFIFVQAPLLVHPAPHWFLGVGPTLYRDLSRGFKDSPRTNDRTTWGFAYEVGGYL